VAVRVVVETTVVLVEQVTKAVIHPLRVMQVEAVLTQATLR
jgi:hypothetical protein